MDTFEFIFSTSTDGKIKAWMYDNMGSRVDYDAPGHSSTTMTYSADGTRLFSCGTNKEGESFLVEWNESEGAVKHTYHGLGKRSAGVAQFDTTKNRFLAAGDEFTIKFWDMDNTSLLTSIDADGGLLASPCIRFNKEGILLGCREGTYYRRFSIYQGVAILALAANAVHKLWKWQKNDRNTSGKATASLQPQL
ncbi:hypothetical protein P8452_45936 [Trifolium repens]|nr:hypothetical protein P8452_45936 [Trifolium repens]